MRRIASAILIAVMFSTSSTIALAQDQAAEDRPGIPTVWGDRGLWFVPTAEVPAQREWSVSLYRSDLANNQGFTQVTFWPVTASVGVGRRVELFGSLHALTRIDRDTRPMYDTDPPPNGGVLND